MIHGFQDSYRLRLVNRDGEVMSEVVGSKEHLEYLASSIISNDVDFGYKLQWETQTLMLGDYFNSHVLVIKSDYGPVEGMHEHVTFGSKGDV